MKYYYWDQKEANHFTLRSWFTNLVKTATLFSTFDNEVEAREFFDGCFAQGKELDRDEEGVELRNNDDTIEHYDWGANR